MSVEPTGGDTHNLQVNLGHRDLAGLVSDVGEGVYIERFLGGTVTRQPATLASGVPGVSSATDNTLSLL